MATAQIIENLKDILKSRTHTISVITNIYEECQRAGKIYNKTNIFTRVLSLTAGTLSVGLAIATPLTAGLTGGHAVVLAGVSVATSVASLGTLLAQTISENGLLRHVNEALDEDRLACERLESSLNAFLEMKSLAMETKNVVTSLAKIGMVTLNDSANILKASNNSMMIFDSITDTAELFGKAGRVMTKVSKVVSVVSIPIDVMLLIADLKDCTNENYSNAAAKIINVIMELTQMVAKIQDFIAELQG